MITAYTANTPNGVKVTIALEALGLIRGADYELKIFTLSERKHKEPDYLAVNPNGRIPAIVDHTEGGDVRVFESGAVLLYLAETFGGLLPKDPAARIEAIAWSYFQTGGIGPNMGQAGYLKRQFEKAGGDSAGFERFNTESHRLVSVMESVLSSADYLAGGEFSIADIMNFGWLDRAPSYMDFDLAPYPGVRAWLTRIRGRDDVRRGLAVFD